MGLVDKLDEFLFDIQWKYTVEKPVEKELKKIGDTIDEAVRVLEDATGVVPQETMEAFENEVHSETKRLIAKGEAYEKLYPFAVYSFNDPELCVKSITETLDGTFGMEEGAITLTPVKEKRKFRSVGYMIELREDEKAIVFNKI